MKHNIIRGIIATLLILIALAAAGSAAAIYRTTLVEWWIYPAVALSLAAVTAIPGGTRRLWGKVTGSSSAILNTAAHIVFVTALATFALFAINRYGADDSRATVTETRVIRRYTETRYHTRRINRRTSVRGEPYTVYILDLQLPDGRVKQQTVTLSTYNSTRRGATRPCTVRPGLLGADIITID